MSDLIMVQHGDSGGIAPTDGDVLVHCGCLKTMLAGTWHVHPAPCGTEVYTPEGGKARAMWLLACDTHHKRAAGRAHKIAARGVGAWGQG